MILTHACIAGEKKRGERKKWGVLGVLCCWWWWWKWTGLLALVETGKEDNSWDPRLWDKLWLIAGLALSQLFLIYYFFNLNLNKYYSVIQKALNKMTGVSSRLIIDHGFESDSHVWHTLTFCFNYVCFLIWVSIGTQCITSLTYIHYMHHRFVINI